MNKIVYLFSLILLIFYGKTFAMENENNNSSFNKEKMKAIAISAAPAGLAAAIVGYGVFSDKFPRTTLAAQIATQTVASAGCGYVFYKNINERSHPALPFLVLGGLFSFSFAASAIRNTALLKAALKAK